MALWSSHSEEGGLPPEFMVQFGATEPIDFLAHSFKRKQGLGVLGGEQGTICLSHLDQFSYAIAALWDLWCDPPEPVLDWVERRMERDG
eukprot:5917672-Amphidinium_carterae.2